MPAGVYSFELTLDKFRNGTKTDSQSWRSYAVQFDKTDLVNDNGQLKFHYGIAPWGALTPNALSEVRIQALNGNWTGGSHTTGPKTLNPSPLPLHIVNAPAATNNEPGEGRVIATGVDDEAKRYRDHQKKRLWPLNQVGPLIYRMYVGEGPELAGEIDSEGDLTLANITKITTPKGKQATIYTLGLDEQQNLSPTQIWKELADQKSRPGQGNTRWYPVLATTHAHSNAGAHDISHIGPGSARGGPFGWWGTGAGTGFDMNLNAISTPDLKGITFFNMMGCKTSNTAASSNRVATTFGSIAQVVSVNKKARNSIGYKDLVYFKWGNGYGTHWPGQWWFDSLYSKESLSYPTAASSADWAQIDYETKLINEGAGGPFGWDTWIVTNHNPILDR